MKTGKVVLIVGGGLVALAGLSYLYNKSKVDKLNARCVQLRALAQSNPTRAQVEATVGPLSSDFEYQQWVASMKTASCSAKAGIISLQP